MSSLTLNNMSETNFSLVCRCHNYRLQLSLIWCTAVVEAQLMSVLKWRFLVKCVKHNGVMLQIYSVQQEHTQVNYRPLVWDEYKQLIVSVSMVYCQIILNEFSSFGGTDANCS
jgi:hypothetical protein